MSLKTALRQHRSDIIKIGHYYGAYIIRILDSVKKEIEGPESDGRSRKWQKFTGPRRNGLQSSATPW